jgi:DNA-binding transcriptional LysR family regulator
LTSRFRLHHLEIFWAVIRTGSQRGAAELLGLSQPAVSKLLRHVEDQVGMPLFRRSKGRLIPTPEARVFFESVDDIFARVEGAERLVRELKRRFSGQLTVVSVPGLSAAFVPEVIGRFLKEQTDVRIGITGLPTAQVIDRVLKKQAHIGLVYGPIEATAAETVLLCNTQIVCALPEGHRLAGKQVIAPTDLAGEPIISAAFMPQWGQLVDQAFETAGVTRNIVANCANSDLAYRMAAEGAGIAVVPIAPLRKGAPKPVVLRRFAPTISLPVLAVHDRTEPLDHLAAGLIGRLRASTRDYEWDAPMISPGKTAGTRGRTRREEPQE